MKLGSYQKTNKGKNLPLLEVIAAIYAWLEIVAASVIVGLIIGTIVYYLSPNSTRLAIGISITVVGLVVGIILATISWKKNRASYFMCNSGDAITPETTEVR